MSRWAATVGVALLLSSCGPLPWSVGDSVRSRSRRRAVPTSQRREARMARPQVSEDRPLVDYGAYKRINPGMELAEVQALLKQAGQEYDVLADAAGNPGLDSVTGSMKGSAAGDTEVPGEADVFWRWTHGSGGYNIHVRLTAGAQPNNWIVQSKWLTYSSPE